MWPIVLTCNLIQQKGYIRVLLDSVSDLLVSKDVDRAKLWHALQIQDLDNGPREAALRSFLGAFHKDEHRMGFDSLVQFCTELRREAAHRRSEMASSLGDRCQIQLLDYNLQIKHTNLEEKDGKRRTADNISVISILRLSLFQLGEDKGSVIDKT